MDEEQGGGGVPGVVQAGVADVGSLEEPFPVGPVGAGVDGCSGLGGEDEVVLGPQVRCGETFDGLLVAVSEQGVDELGWQGDAAPAGAGLGFDEGEAAAEALGAVGGAAASALAAAAVLGGGALQGAADGDGAGVEVDVAPAQAERFALAQAEGEADEPATW